MKEQLRLLSELQVLEQHKQAVAGQKAKINSEEVRLLWQDIRRLTQNLAAAREKLVALEVACSEQEAVLSAATRQCESLEKKMYGGEITNVKEIDQIQAKCEFLRKDIGKRENELVAALLDCENIGQQVALDETGLREKKRLHAEKQQQMTKAIGRLEAELAGIESRYTTLAARVEPRLLRLFRDLGRKLPAPVAKVEGGICGGCRRSLPTGQTAQAADKLAYCDNCGRILLVE